jgi:hypothetical protein
VSSARRRPVARPRGVPARRQRGTWTALLLCAASVTGCYTSRLVTAPSPGATVVLDLNDRARVQLGDRIGPSAASIEGVVQAQGDSGYVVNITSVKYLNGQANQWSGERFTVSPALVTQVWQREFSRSKTAALGVSVGAAILAAVLKTNLFGQSSGTPPVSPPPTGGGT